MGVVKSCHFACHLEIKGSCGIFFSKFLGIQDSVIIYLKCDGKVTRIEWKCEQVMIKVASYILPSTFLLSREIKFCYCYKHVNDGVCSS